MHVLQDIVQDGRQGPKAALKELARQGAEGAEGLAEQAQQRLRERVAQDYDTPLDPVSCLCDSHSQRQCGRQPCSCMLDSLLGAQRVPTQAQQRLQVGAVQQYGPSFVACA